MMKHLIAFAVLLSLYQNISAQNNIQKKELNVGDYILIKPCRKGAKEIISMDVYSRTNPYRKSKVNMQTGEGLYEEFFKDKSIDAKPLPCVMSGKKYKVAALQEFNVNGQYKRVVLCYTSYHLTLIWIEFDKALQNNEIIF